MKRKISPDEVRQFLATINKEFEEADMYLRTVHFDRDDNASLTGIRLTYERHGKYDDKPTTIHFK